MLYGKNICFGNLTRGSVDCRQTGCEISDSYLLELTALFSIITIDISLNTLHTGFVYPELLATLAFIYFLPTESFNRIMSILPEKLQNSLKRPRGRAGGEH